MTLLRTIILSIFIILVFVNISSAIPQFPHKPIYCFNNCHGERGFFAGDNGGDDCGNCHTFYFNNPNFPEQHDAKACLGCHKVRDKDSFHTLHISYNVSCSRCHMDNVIPDNIYSECLGCHIQGLHIVHENKSCFICHEITISNKIIITNESIKNASKAVNKTKVLNTSKPIINYKKITIYEILMNLIKAIRDDIYGKNNMDNNVIINGNSSIIDRE